MSECKRCGTELTKDEDRGCFYCGLCHPIQNKSVPMEQLEKNYIDVKPSEKRVEEIIKIIKNIVPDIIREELENWHMDKPVVDEPIIEDNKNWKADAKELNIEVYDKENKRPRKKVDVIADIEKAKASN